MALPIIILLYIISYIHSFRIGLDKKNMVHSSGIYEYICLYCEGAREQQYIHYLPAPEDYPEGSYEVLVRLLQCLYYPLNHVLFRDLGIVFQPELFAEFYVRFYLPARTISCRKNGAEKS